LESYYNTLLIRWIEKRSERILDADSLEQVIARVLNLPKKQLQDLRRWRHEPIAGDLAACVERVLESMADVSEPLAPRFNYGGRRR
jgi:hypothetical protein